ncbi:MAG TPA: Uma2 family endonuclease [Chloroflexota bacterium]|jgi:Uma2 family endonuclease|nr:Uma2 family endonuclease [Chloroflexota bacterium]
MAVQQQRMTIEEFMALPDDGNRHELVRGEVRTMPPPKGIHGFVEAALVEAIGRYLTERAGALGWEPRQGLRARHALVGRIGAGEVGLRFAVADDPTMIRGADLVYIPPEQLAQVAWDEQQYFPAVPALVIEIISETDRASAVAEKVEDYLAGGGRRVWCVYPEQRAIHIHDVDAPTRVVRGESSVVDDLLPGFSLPLNLIFG